MNNLLWIFNWNSSGFLDKTSNISISFPDGTQGVRIGDIDHDGVNELLGSDTHGDLMSFKWNGTHYVQKWNGTFGTILGRYDSLQIGDADNNGQNEIVFGENSPNIHVLEFFGVINGTLNVGADGDTEWSQLYVFDGTATTADVAVELNEAISATPPDPLGYVHLPLQVQNSWAGNFTLLNLLITYETGNYTFVIPIANNSNLVYYQNGAATPLDTDADGLSDYAEDVLHGTSANNNDTDADGLSDFVEVTGITNPLLWDTDGDGLNDSYELLIAPTDPLNNDTDGDSLLDGAELLTHCTNPILNDTDADGLLDGDELHGTYGFITGPLQNDTDHDFLTDGEEILMIGTDPTNPDTDGDGIIDGLDDNPLESRWLLIIIIVISISVSIAALFIILIFKKRKRKKKVVLGNLRT